MFPLCLSKTELKSSLYFTNFSLNLNQHFNIYILINIFNNNLHTTFFLSKNYHKENKD